MNVSERPEAVTKHATQHQNKTTKKGHWASRLFRNPHPQVGRTVTSTLLHVVGPLLSRQPLPAFQKIP
jgi:hypothetical protein